MSARRRLWVALLFTLLAIAGCARAKPPTTLFASHELLQPVATTPALPQPTNAPGAVSASATPQVTLGPTAAYSVAIPAAVDQQTAPSATPAFRVAIPAAVDEAGALPDRTPPPSCCATPAETPGSDEAILLVREYLEDLNKGDAKRAYQLLHEEYQKRLSYASFAESYEAVASVEIHGIETVQLDEYKDLVRAGLTLGIRERGVVVYSDWVGTYEVMITRGKPPYQRAITASSLSKLAAN